jgi:hypothetical protein
LLLGPACGVSPYGREWSRNSQDVDAGGTIVDLDERKQMRSPARVHYGLVNQELLRLGGLLKYYSYAA